MWFINCACKRETESENEIIVSSDLSPTHLKSDPNRYGWICHQLEGAPGKTGCHFWKGYPRECVTNWPPRVRLSGTLYNSGQRGVFGVSNRGMYMLVCDTLHDNIHYGWSSIAYKNEYVLTCGPLSATIPYSGKLGQA